MERRRKAAGLLWVSRLLLMGVILCGVFFIFWGFLWVVVKVKKWLAF